MNEIHGCNQLLDLAEDILVQQTEEKHGKAALTLSHQLAEWFSALLQFAHLAQKSGSRGERGSDADCVWEFGRLADVDGLFL